MVRERKEDTRGTRGEVGVSPPREDRVKGGTNLSPTPASRGAKEG